MNYSVHALSRLFLFSKFSFQGIGCTFDSDLCGWQQSLKDDFDWSVRSGQTLSDNTGPSQGDHTTGKGQTMVDLLSVLIINNTRKIRRLR